MTTTEPAVAADAEAFAERLLHATLGATDLLAVWLGDQLGWYASLAADGPASAEELASRTGTDARYAREWLEHQAVAGILVLEPPTQRSPDGEANRRRFRLPPAVAEVLTDRRSLLYLAPLGRMLAALGPHLPALLDAYRSGGGVSWAELGADAREAQADMNRPWYESRLAEALAAVPELHATLGRPGALLADVGCGAGWSSIALAAAYPQSRVEGFDVDGPSVELARTNADAAGVASRVTFHHVDGTDLPSGPFDAVFAFECLHDMPHPVEVLAAARRRLAPNGVVVVMDEAVADTFTAPGDEQERLMYGFSLFVCLPDGMSHPNSAATGTVMRRSTLERYAREAGFTRVDVLPIEGFGFWRFYQLTP